MAGSDGKSDCKWRRTKDTFAGLCSVLASGWTVALGEGAWKKSKKKLTSVSFMYVCVAENAELLVFFYFFFAPSP